MKRCERCIWADRHTNRGKVVRVVCPFRRCVETYGWEAPKVKKDAMRD